MGNRWEQKLEKKPAAGRPVPTSTWVDCTCAGLVGERTDRMRREHGPKGAQPRWQKGFLVAFRCESKRGRFSNDSTLRVKKMAAKLGREVKE